MEIVQNIRQKLRIPWRPFYIMNEIFATTRMLGYEAAVRAAAILQCWARLTEDLLRNTDKSSLNLRRILTPQLPPCPTIFSPLSSSCVKFSHELKKTGLLRVYLGLSFGSLGQCLDGKTSTRVVLKVNKTYFPWKCRSCAHFTSK